jgi:hypothetical protein
MLEDIAHVVIFLLQLLLVDVFYFCHFFLILKVKAFNIQLKLVILALESVDLVLESLLLIVVPSLQAFHFFLVSLSKRR